MKSWNFRFLTGLFAAVTVLLIVVGRSVFSWRPELLGIFPYKAPVTAFALSDDQRLMAMGKMSYLAVKDLASGVELGQPALPSSDPQEFVIIGLAFSHDRKMLAIAREEYVTNGTVPPPEVWVWPIGGKVRRMELTTNTSADFGSLSQLRFSPDNKSIWMASTINFRAWEVSSGEIIKESDHKEKWTGHYILGHSALSPDFRSFYRARGTDLSTWGTARDRLLRRFVLTKLTEKMVVFDEQQPIVYYADASAGGIWIARDVLTGKELWRTPDEVMFASKGVVLCRRQDWGLEVRDAITGRDLRRLPMVSNSLPRAIRGDYVYSIRKDGWVFRQRLE